MAGKQPLRPVAAVEPTSKGSRTEGFGNVQEYLARFGYLEEGGYSEGVLDDSTAQSLERYQRFFGLRPTGEFDADTRQMMSVSRCGLPDPEGDDVAFSLACKWNKTTLSFRFDTSTADTAGEFAAVRRAFMTWSSVVGLTFVEQASGVDLEVDWRPATDPDHSMVGGVLAHADFPPGCPWISDTPPKPLHYDDSEHTWVVGAVSGGYDVETVALHEIGHLIGLYHSSVAGSVMWPSVSDNSTKRVLTADDITGARNQYSAVSVQSDWRWCTKCQGMHFGGHLSDSNCPAGGTHSTAGSGNYRIHHNSAAAPGQLNWRWCNKCQGLWFAGNNTAGHCQQGGGHSMVGSGNYRLLQNTAGAIGQHNWRWCNKCQGLWFAGNNTAGVCPNGGGHANVGSGNYRVMSI